MIKLVSFFALVLELTFHFSNAEPIRGNNVETVDEGELPFVASIVRRSSSLHVERDHICTGVLISREHILTAAHCFKGHLLGEIQIVLGSVDLRNGTRYEPSKWITYDQWINDKKIDKKYESNDIAIIELSEKLDKRVAKPAVLSLKKCSKLVFVNVTLAGWGSTNLKERPTRYLLKTRVVVLPDEACASWVYIMTNAIVTVPDNKFCTKAKPHALIDCGDSGGPVLNAKGKVVGISIASCPKYNSSYSQEQNDGYRVNVHMSVQYYKSFINDVLKNY